MTAGRTVFQIKSAISWACEPPHTAILKMKKDFPEMGAPVRKRVVRVSLTESEQFSPVFSASGSHRN